MSMISASGDVYTIDTSSRKLNVTVSRIGLPGRGVPFDGQDGEYLSCVSGLPVWKSGFDGKDVFVDLSDLDPEIGASVESILRSVLSTISETSVRVDDKLDKGTSPNTVPVMLGGGDFMYKPLEELPGVAVDSISKRSVFKYGG